MSREWQPGDVAMRIGPGDRNPSLVATRVAGCAVGSSLADLPHWHFVSPHTPIPQCGSDDLAEYRPLVVIDPEQIPVAKGGLTPTWLRGLARSLREDDRTISTSLENVLTFLADEIERQVETKPDEPTGLGAVVECSDGRHFVRTRNADSRFPWVLAEKPDGNAYNWTTHGGLDGSTPVRVLSEGVTP